MRERVNERKEKIYIHVYFFLNEEGTRPIKFVLVEN